MLVRRRTDVNKETPELAPCPEAAAGRPRPVLLGARTTSSSSATQPSSSFSLPCPLLLQVPVADYACACTTWTRSTSASAWCRPAGWLLSHSLRTPVTLRGRPWRCNGDAQLVMGVAARAKPPPCNVERRSIPTAPAIPAFPPPWTVPLSPPYRYILLSRRCVYTSVVTLTLLRLDGSGWWWSLASKLPSLHVWRNGGFRVIAGEMVGLIRPRSLCSLSPSTSSKRALLESAKWFIGAERRGEIAADIYFPHTFFTL